MGDRGGLTLHSGWRSGYRTVTDAWTGNSILLHLILWSLAGFATILLVGCGGTSDLLIEAVVSDTQCIEDDRCLFIESRIARQKIMSHRNDSGRAERVSVKIENQGKCNIIVKWQLSGGGDLEDLVLAGAGEKDSKSAQLPNGRQAVFYWVCTSVRERECRGIVTINVT